MVSVSRESCSRVCQGDVIRDVEYLEKATEREGIIEVFKVVFPLAIVLTQDCDLAQDHKFRTQEQANQDKWLISVLVAPIYNAEHVFAGEHLSEIGVRSQPINKKKTDGRRLVQNKDPRYHYLEFPRDVEIVPSIVDFKHYFACPISHLEAMKNSRRFVCKTSDLPHSSHG
jgi:hypothetical protein